MDKITDPFSDRFSFWDSRHVINYIGGVIVRSFIHGFQGKPYNSDCQAAYDGFRELGIELVLLPTNEEFDKRNPEDVVVGG